MSWDDVKVLEVTAEDIANGNRQCGDCCPIALAANRAFGVTNAAIFDDRDGNWQLRIYEMRWYVRGGADFAINFDGERTVHPDVFELERLDDSEEES